MALGPDDDADSCTRCWADGWVCSGPHLCVCVCVADDGAPFEEELDDGEALQAAARAGILLLEKNHELQEENAALREQVAVLEQERPTLKDALAARDEELAGLRDERRRSLLEVNALRNEVKAQSGLVTELLERERRLKSAAEEAELARQDAEAQLETLQRVVDEVQQRAAALSAEEDASASSKQGDAGAAGSSEAAENDDVLGKWHEAVAEIESLQLELKSSRKEGDALKRKTAKLSDCVAQLERMEKKNAKLQSANDTLHEELEEERAVLESLRTMNLMYKKLADSRPFAFDDDASNVQAHSQPLMPVSMPGSVTLQDVLLETNLKLETEIRELKIALNRDHPNNNDGEEGDNNSSHDSDDADLGLQRSGSSSSIAKASGSGTKDNNDSDDSALEQRLVRRVQELEEKLKVAKDVIKHAKLHWSAAVASQKALEECNRDAQDELARLTQQLDYYVSLATSRALDPEAQKEELLRNRDGDNKDGEFEEKWVEETAPYPAPPGDLNSPLIKCLLDHWTTDKSQVMMLTDWLHHAIRGTGKPTALHLPNLSSEVAAGFAQLLVPILRERHGVSVTIYRRDSLQILSDLLLQTNQPSVDVPAFSTDEAAPLDGGADGREASESPASSGISRNGSSGRRGRSARRKRGSSPFLKGETQFLYG